MKAITISQPWANLIATGDKIVENRTWYTAYRGPIAIHAGRGLQYISKADARKYPMGKVVAIAELTACFLMEAIGEVEMNQRVSHRSRWTFAQVIGHKYAEGPYCWLLEDARRIEPIDAVGKQQIWNWDNPEVLRVLR